MMVPDLTDEQRAELRTRGALKRTALTRTRLHVIKTAATLFAKGRPRREVQEIAVVAGVSETCARNAMARAYACGVFTFVGMYPTRYCVWPSVERLELFADWPQSRLEAYSQLAEHIVEHFAERDNTTQVDEWTRRLVACRSNIRRVP